MPQYYNENYVGINGQMLDYAINCNITFECNNFKPNGLNGVYICLSGDHFNGKVTLPDYVTDCKFLFYECYDYNYPFNIPNNATSCLRMFENCISFNQPVNIPSSVNNCLGMFRYCAALNQPINAIPNGVDNCARMFYDCYSFNQPLIIPDSVINCAEMFMGSGGTNNIWDTNNTVTGINSPIVIGNNVIYCMNMFYRCKNFNQPINIPASVKNCNSMFYGCDNFNQTVNIPNGVENCFQMFAYCNNLNRPITIPSSVNCCEFMFMNCYNLKHFPVMADGPKDCYAMFRCAATTGNSHVEQDIKIPNEVMNCYDMFYNASRLYGNVILPTMVSPGCSYREMFRGCQNITVNNIFIADGVSDCSYMFMNSTINGNYTFNIPNSVDNYYCMLALRHITYSNDNYVKAFVNDDNRIYVNVVLPHYIYVNYNGNNVPIDNPPFGLAFSTFAAVDGGWISSDTAEFRVGSKIGMTKQGGAIDYATIIPFKETELYHYYLNLTPSFSNNDLINFAHNYEDLPYFWSYNNLLYRGHNGYTWDSANNNYKLVDPSNNATPIPPKD